MNKVHVTKHEGKLAGILSVNVSTNGNDFCTAMRKCEGSVCASCYAGRLETHRTRLGMALLRNSELLSSRCLDYKELPWFEPESSVRFDSFGELINLNHLSNIYSICKKNPEVHFALWTKKDFMVIGLGLQNVPKNLVLIYSELNVDEPNPRIVEGFDYTYVVHGKDSGYPPCGEKCIDCLKCYRKRPAGADKVIHQLIH